MWNRWKLKTKCGTPTKNYIGQNGLKLKDGRVLNLKDKKYDFVLFTNGAIAVIYNGGFYEQNIVEIIDHKDWEVVFNDR
jgi:hypothetical protein